MKSSEQQGEQKNEQFPLFIPRATARPSRDVSHSLHVEGESLFVTTVGDYHDISGSHHDHRVTVLGCGPAGPPGACGKTAAPARTPAGWGNAQAVMFYRPISKARSGNEMETESHGSVGGPGDGGEGPGRGAGRRAAAACGPRRHARRPAETRGCDGGPRGIMMARDRSVVWVCHYTAVDRAIMASPCCGGGEGSKQYGQGPG
jgi:hypothetical protein